MLYGVLKVAIVVNATFVEDGNVVLILLFMYSFKEESVDCKFKNPNPLTRIKFTVSAS